MVDPVVQMPEAVAGVFRPGPGAVQAMGQGIEGLPPESDLIVACPGELRAESGDIFPLLTQGLGRVSQAGGKPVELLGALGEAVRELAGNAAPELLQVGEQGIAVRAEDLGGGGRRRRAQVGGEVGDGEVGFCLLYTSPSPRDRTRSRMPSSA